MKIRAKLNRKVKADSICRRRLLSEVFRNWGLMAKVLENALPKEYDFSVWEQRKKDMAA